MKALLFFIALLLLNFTVLAAPPDLCADKDFVQAVKDAAALQLKIQGTYSGALFLKSVNGTITENEQLTLATNLGYSSYSKLNDALSALGQSIRSIAIKYNLVTTDVFNSAIDKTVQQANPACLRALFNDLLNCLRTSGSFIDFSICVRAAYAKYLQCRG